MPTPKIKLAVFDIDGTIFRSSLGVEFIHALVDEGVFPARAWDEVEKDYTAWLNREGDYKQYLTQLVNIFIKYLPGKSEATLHEISEQILSEQKDHHYRFTRNLVHGLKQKGYLLVAISGSPDFLVNQFAHFLGFEATFGTHLIVKDGRYTGGAIIGDDNKYLILKKFIEENQFKINWKSSVAVGDTETDIPLLEAVGKPIAFNPNFELAKFAQKRGWKIVVERKDVIYNLKKFTFEV